MAKTRVRAHRRKGTKGVRKHSRKKVIFTPTEEAMWQHIQYKIIHGKELTPKERKENERQWNIRIRQPLPRKTKAEKELMKSLARDIQREKARRKKR